MCYDMYPPPHSGAGGTVGADARSSEGAAGKAHRTQDRERMGGWSDQGL